INLLDNEDLIATLQEAKATSSVITERLDESENTNAQIQASREEYRPAAARGSILYFTMATFGRVGIMYQYSLEFFGKLFCSVVQQTIDQEDSSRLGEKGQAQRHLQSLLDRCTMAVYENVSRGLFERHKLLFAFLLSSTIQLSEGVATPDEWVLVLRGAK
ncbi:unnamed protein product, partial [Chrysoparadoxa australica]